MTEAIDHRREGMVATMHQRRPDSDSWNSVAPLRRGEDNPYLEDFSRRLADRLARLPAGTGHFSFDDDDECRVSWRLLGRSYKLLMTFMAGAILYGATVYPLLSELRSPGVSSEGVPQRQ